MQDSAAVVSQHQEYVEYLKANGRHREEVDGHHGPDMILKEGSPGLRRRLPPTCHVLAHARFPDVDAQFEQFTMDTRRTPEWILPAHPANQLTNLFGHRWSSRLAPPNLPSPEQPKSLAMPANDGFRFDDQQRRLPIAPSFA